MDWERLGNNGMKVGACTCVIMPGAGIPIIIVSLIIREIGKIYNTLKQNSKISRNQVTNLSRYSLFDSVRRSSKIEQASVLRTAV